MNEWMVTINKLREVTNSQRWYEVLSHNNSCNTMPIIFSGAFKIKDVIKFNHTMRLLWYYCKQYGTKTSVPKIIMLCSIFNLHSIATWANRIREELVVFRLGKPLKSLDGFCHSIFIEFPFQIQIKLMLCIFIFIMCCRVWSTVNTLPPASKK